MKAISGLMLFAIALIIMINSIHWLVGLFLMLAAAAQGFGAYLDKKDCKQATVACLYFLFAIVFFVKEGIASDMFFFGLWGMLEGILLAFFGWKLKQENANLWFVPACLGCLAVLLAFISCFLEPSVINLTGNFYTGLSVNLKVSPVAGIAFIFVALGQIFPMCAGCLPKCEIKLNK